MRRIMMCSVAVGLALALGIGSFSVGAVAWADPPGGFGHGRGHGSDRYESRDHGSGHGHDRLVPFRFGGRDRIAIQDYFSHAERRGWCPPGLAKKHDGCVPPGHARRWRVGEPLPRGVTYYNLPPALVAQLTPPPVGYRYARVGSDILMIAQGTGMVAAAIQDLAR